MKCTFFTLPFDSQFSTKSHLLQRAGSLDALLVALCSWLSYYCEELDACVVVACYCWGMSSLAGWQFTQTVYGFDGRHFFVWVGKKKKRKRQLVLLSCWPILGNRGPGAEKWWLVISHVFVLRVCPIQALILFLKASIAGWFISDRQSVDHTNAEPMSSVRVWPFYGVVYASNNSSLQQFQNEERKCSFWQGFCIRSKYSIIAFLKMRLYNVCVQRRCHMLAFHDVETKAHWNRHAYWLLSASSQKGANGACRFQLSLGSVVLESVCVSMVWAFITSGSKRDLNMYLIKIQVAQMKAAWMNYS